MADHRCTKGAAEERAGLKPGLYGEQTGTLGQRPARRGGRAVQVPAGKQT